MSFVVPWVETDPDGSLITVSQLDNFIRDTKVGVRERLEGDPLVPLTGVVELFGTVPTGKLGAARVNYDTLANIASMAKQNGRLAITSDQAIGYPRLWELGTIGIREIAYLNIDGTKPMLGELAVGTTFTGATTNGTGLSVGLTTANTAFTVTNMRGLWIKSPTKGAASTITNLYGIYVEDMTVGGTINAALTTGLGTVHFGGWFDIFANGDIKLGNDTQGTASTTGHMYIISVAGAPTGVPAGHTGHVAMEYDSTNNQIYVYNGAWKKTVALT